MTPQFTDRQLDIMNVLWDRGSATVREAEEALEYLLTRVFQGSGKTCRRRSID